MFDCTQDWYKVWRKTGLCFQKLTWGICQIFTRALESLQIGTLMAYFWLKLKMYVLKIHRGVMSHDNEEWCKNWRGIDLPVHNWHEKFDDFWPKHSKISKICTLMGCFWPKYTMFELRKVYRSYVWWYWILMQNLKKNDLCFQKWNEEFSRFLPEHMLESLKIGTFMGSIHPKLKMYGLKIYRRVLCHDNEEWNKIWRGIDLSIQNWQGEYWQILTRVYTQKSQKFAL